MALFRCGAGAEKLQLEKGHFLATRFNQLPTTGAYTSGSNIISGNGFSGTVVIAPNTNSTTIAMSSGSNQAYSVAGLKNGELVDPTSVIDRTSFSQTFTDCDLIIATACGGSTSYNIKATDN